MVLDETDSNPEVTVQVPLVDVASQISLTVSESFHFNLQDWFPTENLENRIIELAKTVEHTRHKH